MEGISLISDMDSRLRGNDTIRSDTPGVIPAKAGIHVAEEHFYAQERYRAYRDTLQAHHLPCDDGVITLPYAWDSSYGAEAAHLLLRVVMPGFQFELEELFRNPKEMLL